MTTTETAPAAPQAYGCETCWSVWTDRVHAEEGPRHSGLTCRVQPMTLDEARTALTRWSETKDERKRLAAAAPDLLDACQLLGLIEQNGIGHVIDVMPAVLAARAAIAKAKGVT